MESFKSRALAACCAKTFDSARFGGGRAGYTIPRVRFPVTNIIKTFWLSQTDKIDKSALRVALDLAGLQLERKLPPLLEQFQQDAHPLGAGQSGVENGLVAAERAFHDAHAVAGFQPVEEFAAEFVDFLHALAQAGDQSLGDARRNAIEGDEAGRARHPLERGGLVLPQVNLQKDVARKVRTQLSGARVDGGHAQERAIGLEPVRFELVEQEILFARFAVENVPGCIHSLFAGRSLPRSGIRPEVRQEAGSVLRHRDGGPELDADFAEHPVVYQIFAEAPGSSEAESRDTALARHAIDLGFAQAQVDGHIVDGKHNGLAECACFDLVTHGRLRTGKANLSKIYKILRMVGKYNHKTHQLLYED